MNSNISIFLLFTCFAFQINGFSQNFQGIYQSINLDNPLVLSVSEQGELLMGKLYRSDLSSKEFVGRKSKIGFAGVFEVEGEAEEVHGVITKKSLTLTLKASDFLEASQMMAWKIVGNNIHIFPSQSIPGAPNFVQISNVDFEDGKMILKNTEFGWIEVYERKD